MKQKEITSFSYGVVAVLGGCGLLFSLLGPNGSSGAAAVGALFVVLGLGGIVRNSRKRRSTRTDATGKNEENHTQR